jgi:hypothetical protein
MSVSEVAWLVAPFDGEDNVGAESVLPPPVPVRLLFLPHPPINKEVAIIPKIKNDFIRTNNSFIENLLANNCGR